MPPDHPPPFQEPPDGDAPVEPVTGGGPPPLPPAQPEPEVAAASAEAAETDGEGLRAWIADLPWAAWLTSTIVHTSLLLVLSVLLIVAPKDNLLLLTGGDSDATLLEDMEVEDLPFDDISEDDLPFEDTGGPTSLGPIAVGDDISLPGPEVGAIGNVLTGATNDGAVDGGSGVAEPTFDALPEVGDIAVGDGGSFSSDLAALTNPLETRGGGLEGRTFENRTAAALSGGGTRESEAAVELGLEWLAEHQFEDGSWRFDLTAHPRCTGECRDSGTFKSSTAATGLALLSFLGAGYTHREGKYQEVVERGIYYLNEHMNITSRGGDLRDTGADPEAQVELGLLRGMNLPTFTRDTMYSHGIATIALTEAYAMSGDIEMRKPATEAVHFIISAQYDDGGWRYNPKWEVPGPGDMTVTGWQLMALKSAVLAGIEVPHEVWARANDFLDALQENDGATYKYLADREGTRATTAVGLLCRMIEGWPSDARPLQRGTARLGDQTPMQNNMYYNYYASQVLHHIGGPRWEKWNPKMREYLLDLQSHDGHEEGSWYIAESHSTPGGRLYTTTLAIMTLEVYYRYMPLYKEKAVGGGPR